MLIPRGCCSLDGLPISCKISKGRPLKAKDLRVFFSFTRAHSIKGLARILQEQSSELDIQAQAQEQQAERTASEEPKKRREQDQHARRQAKLTVEQGIENYLHDHEGGNHSPKTLEWHRTALGLLQDSLYRNEKPVVAIPLLLLLRPSLSFVTRVWNRKKTKSDG